MNAEILKELIRAHVEGDENAFRKLALQLAAGESKAGHVRVAEQLREVIAKLPVSGESKRPVDIARPRGELADLLEGGFRHERMRDVVLDPDLNTSVERVLRENRLRIDLERWNVQPTRRLLFYGPPGCGKTLAAQVIAGELGLPLMTLRFDALFSRFLGATASHLKIIFDEMPRRPAVYLFDEFDAIGKYRGDTQDVGEIRRVVTTFLQLMDSDRSNALIIAATNYEELLDRAIFRRFDLVLKFPPPTREQIEGLIAMRLGSFHIPATAIHEAANSALGVSFADAARACDDAVRSMALDRREQLAESDILHAFRALKARALTPTSR